MKKFFFILATALAALLVSLALLELFFYFLPPANRLFRAPRGQQAIPVYVVGESSAVGEPYEDKLSFAKIISFMYGGKIAGREMRIVNLGVRGTSIEDEYWKLFTELTLRPPQDGILLVYAGINDTSPGHDPHYALWRCAQSSIALSKLLSLFQNNSLVKNVVIGENSNRKYEYRLRKIITLAQRCNVNVIVSTLAGNYADFAPADDSLRRDAAVKTLYGRGLALEAAGKTESAAALYAGLLETAGSGRAHILYRLGKCSEKLGRYEKARECYYAAAENLRPTLLQNDTIRKAAAECGAGLADSLKTFEENSPNGIIGYNLFMDAHHPTVRGYTLIARTFAREIGKLYAAAPLRPDLSEKEVMEHFGMDDRDLFNAYISRIQWLCAVSSRHGIVSGYLDRVAEYLAAAETLQGRMRGPGECTDSVNLSHLMLSVMRKDSRGALKWLEKGEFLTKKRKLIRTGDRFYDGWINNCLQDVNLPEEIKEQLSL